MTALVVAFNLAAARRSLRQAQLEARRRLETRKGRPRPRVTPRRPRRLYWVLRVSVAGVGLAAALALRAFQQNVMEYYDPTHIAPRGRDRAGQSIFTLGGMVEEGALSKQHAGSLDVSFRGHRFSPQHLPCATTRCCRICFARVAGMVAHRTSSIASGTFIADEVLAKHDPRSTNRPRSRARSRQARGGELMIVELGHYALILALLLAAAQDLFGLAGPALARERWFGAAPSAAAGQFVFLALATTVLVHASSSRMTSRCGM